MNDDHSKTQIWFRRLAERLIKRRMSVLLLLAFLTAVAAMGLFQLKINASLDGWLMEDDPLKQARRDFEQVFGNKDYVSLITRTDDVFSSANLNLMRKLCERLEAEVPFADSCVSLTNLDFIHAIEDGIWVGELVPDPVPTSASALKEIEDLARTKPYLLGRFFSDDKRQALLMLRLESYPDPKRENEFHTQIEEAVKTVISRDEFKSMNLLDGGEPVLESERMKWFEGESKVQLGFAIAIMLVMLLITQRIWAGFVAPVLSFACPIAIVLGLMGWMEIPIHLIVLPVPLLLTLVLAIGYSVHLLSFFKQHFLATGQRREAIRHALGHTGWPIGLTAITTILGFLAFSIVPILAVRWAGTVSALMIFITYPLVIIFNTVLLSFGSDRKPDPYYTAGKGGRLDRFLPAFGDWVLAHDRAIVLISVLVFGALGASMCRIKVDTDTIKTIGLQVPFIAKAWTMAEGIGSMNAYDLSIELGKDGMAKEPAMLQALDRLTTDIESFPAVKRSSSLVGIIKDLNRSFHGDDLTFFRIPEDRKLIAQLLLLYKMSGGDDTKDWIDSKSRHLRINIELKDYSTQQIADQIEQTRAWAKDLFPNSKIVASGFSVQAAMMVNYLVAGQIKSTLIAIICIGFIFMLVFRDLRLGLIGMIPNIAPVIAALGTMAAFDTPLHQATIMVAPMIIGIAVDDTIHYINHFKQSFLRTGSYEAANRETFRSVGKALLMTSFIIIIGFLTMGASITNLYQHFGIYSSLAVAVALLSDFFLTPVLICWTRPFGPDAGNPPT